MALGKSFCLFIWRYLVRSLVFYLYIYIDKLLQKKGSKLSIQCVKEGSRIDKANRKMQIF
ncbi:hypothetical protein HMPREF1869_01319 [Bacteroidales bacterium KA00251]|nr:hypothetical protein HMPREF1869_01319 [Bacteroidales bacterium KA00251]